MLVRIYTDIIDIVNDNVLFIILKGHPEEYNPRVYPVKIYLRNGETQEGMMTDYSLRIHSRLILDVKQLTVIENMIHDNVKNNKKYDKKNRTLFQFVKKIFSK